ncbi:MAG: apolipoprotein N-acyltransferase [Campylobacteraceae bacterium]|nr:apolipoprotein N-acyltransferase [Campylobacteraceae bacterium]
MVIKKSAYLNRLACKSFYVKILRNYFTISYIIKAFVIAFYLSIFIYLEYFHINSKLLNSLFAIIGFYTLLKANRYEFFWSGFFIGIFWFYWISLSFRYYDLAYLIPVIILGIALIYGLIFRFIAIFDNIYLKTILLFCLSFFAPFGFNWLKLELTLTNTYFGTNTVLYALFLFAIILLIKFSKWYKILAIFIFAVCLYQPMQKTTQTKLNIKITNLNINQSDKWNPKFETTLVKQNFTLIKDAIDKKFDLIILPESAFPQYLNLHIDETDRLKKLSLKIGIITGGLTYENDKIYNSAYFFNKGKMQIGHKIVLVPFGEEIPLPNFIKTYINKIFFDSAKDYSKAKKPTDFVTKGTKFRSAICFEATTRELFENSPKRMIAISNNAWFKPSIEPVLQHLLLKLFATRNNTTIYHSANGGISGIIYP